MWYPSGVMSDIDEIKARINIVDLISARVKLKKAGRTYKALCPFHSEKTPSFIVSPERGTFHCFGCGKGGTAIDWVMEYEHVDFMEALETLAEKTGVKLERRSGDTPEAKTKERMLEAHHLASEYYHFLLTSHPLGEKAREYLSSRGVSDKTAKTYMVGYSPNSWDGLLRFLRKKGYDETFLSQSGLIIPSARGGYDRFRGRIMFALRDHRGRTIGFSGRLLDPKAKEAKYINSPETPLYTKGHMLFGLDVAKASIQKENTAIVMEGEFDVISSFQAGITNAVAIKGSALTEQHVQLLKRFAEKVIFALDADIAGDAASRRGIAIAGNEGLDLSVIEIPGGKDPDEAVRESPSVFKKAIQTAIPIYDYFLHSALRRYDVASAYGKKKVGDELLPVISDIDNPVVQSHYLKKLAKVLDVSETTINDAMKKSARTSKTEYPRKTDDKEAEDQKPQKNQQEQLELLILAYILQTKTKEFFEDLQESFGIAEFSHPAIRRILEALSAHLSSKDVFTATTFADSLPKELIPVFDEAFLTDLSDTENDEATARAWIQTVKELRKYVIRKKIRDLTNDTGDTAKQSGNEAENGQSSQGELAKLTEELRVLEKTTSI